MCTDIICVCVCVCVCVYKRGKNRIFALAGLDSNVLDEKPYSILSEVPLMRCQRVPKQNKKHVNIYVYISISIYLYL